jgi:thiamine kinase-like enzyme
MLTHNEIAQLCSGFLAPANIVSSEKLHNGFSNNNYLIKSKQQHYLLKCYKAHWPTIALTAQKQLSRDDICPSPIWLDKANKRAAFHYIQGTTVTEHIVPPQLVSKLIKVHNYPIKTTVMDLEHALNLYKNTLIYKEYDTQLTNALAAIREMPVTLGFCHNDLVKDNIIVNGDKTYLIDFEYAQSNDVYFDLAALVVCFNLTQSAQSQLLTEYQSKNESREGFYLSQQKLGYYTLFFLILCIGWYEQRGITNKGAELRAQLKNLEQVIISL